MHDHSCSCGHDHHHEHDHGERGTRFVFWLTMGTMAVEIISGWAFGSMALLADGWHMASHAGAMAVAWFAYVWARNNADNPDLVFGAGKVNALAGFASAVGLFLVAAYMAAESLMRLFSPVQISFGPATFVAVLGLTVNLLSAWWLRDEDHVHSHDHNLKAAYIHVLADALTSILAIFALLGGKYYGLTGLIRSWALSERWSSGAGPSACCAKPRASSSTIARSGSAHGHPAPHRTRRGNPRARPLVWNVGPRRLAAHVTVEDRTPRPPEYYKDLLAEVARLEHVIVEVHSCPCPAEKPGQTCPEPGHA
jgi:Co/Zn/Cd efflux system component